MRDISERAESRKRKSTSTSATTQVWSAEFPINQREFLRVRLMLPRNNKPALDLRRWHRPADGSPEKPTGKGFALSTKHITSLAALVNDAAAQTRDPAPHRRDADNGSVSDSDGGVS
jgi:hypothetical protein